MLFLIF